MAMNTPTATKRLTIVHPPRLGSLIRQAVDARFDGNVQRAAAKIGISQPTLSRLVSGKEKKARASTIDALRKLIPYGKRGELEATVLSQEAQQRLREYDRWMKREREYWSGIDHVRAAEGDDGKEIAQRKVMYRLNEKRKLLDHFRRQFPDLFDSFDAFLTRKQHFTSRAELAYGRIIGPLLLKGIGTGSVERTWQELDEVELKQFINAGMNRERILLKRPTDVQRAQDPPPKRRVPSPFRWS